MKCVHDFLFADDAAVTAHLAEGLQQFMTCLNKTCSNIGLAFILKKTQVMGQDMDQPSEIRITNQ